MQISLPDPELTELATGFTVRDYKRARDAQQREGIAEAIRRRFTERYINPASDAKYKHGFTMMAISCLMIEALESFRQGWESSDGKSKAAFCYFFDSNDEFMEFRGHAQTFYKNVRCGILHQAETTGGWRITRKSTAPLFHSSSLTINATRFLKSLHAVLDKYCDGLKTIDWQSSNWRQVLIKMNALCDNCRGE